MIPRSILQCAKAKLAGWKIRCLSKAGRLTLASSVLYSLPIYHMQFIKLPEQTFKALDRICRICIWGEEAGGRKIHSIVWDTICRPKTKGGLGLRRSKEFNKALLAKLLWRIHTENSSMWVLLLKSKYKMNSLVDLDLKPGNWASLIWKSICWSRDLFSVGVGRIVMNGKMTRFWIDRWLGDCRL